MPTTTTADNSPSNRAGVALCYPPSPTLYHRLRAAVRNRVTRHPEYRTVYRVVVVASDPTRAHGIHNANGRLPLTMTELCETPYLSVATGWGHHYATVRGFRWVATLNRWGMKPTESRAICDPALRGGGSVFVTEYRDYYRG